MKYIAMNKPPIKIHEEKVMSLEIITEITEGIEYGALAIDGHSILGGRFYSDINWLHQLKSKIEEYFPHFCNMTADQVLAHPDLLVFKTYVKHQVSWHDKPFYRFGSNESFDYNYNPEHFFAYSIPQIVKE